MNSILFKASLIAAILSLIGGTMVYSAEGKARYPTAVIDRPSIMPTGIVGINLNAGMRTQKDEETKRGHRFVTMDIGTEFGVVDQVEGQFSYDGLAFDTGHTKKTFEMKRSVNVGAKYNFLNISHMSTSANINVPLHVMDGEILRDFTFGLPTAFYNNVMSGGILGRLFTLAMRPYLATQFDFNWWYGYQVYGNFWAMIESSFGTIALKNDGWRREWTAIPFWKELPLNLSMTYAFNHYFDLGAKYWL